MTDIASLINRRQRQILVHSIIYYQFDDNLISDWQYTKWAGELAELQKQYPEIAAKSIFAKAFEDYEGCTGYNLPLDNSWGVLTARKLLQWRDLGYLKGDL